MLKCYIEGRNKTDFVHPDQYKIAEGAVFVENGNETLDSGTIILPQLDHEIQIEPYDVVVIFSTDDSKCKINQRRMCVDTYTCTQTSLDPAIFKYEISLFSETKLLEGILCPSLSITKLASGQRSVWYYLQQYLNEYGTKKSVNPANMVGTNKFSFASRVQDMFQNKVCPELQWNEPTFREVFNDLMMVADCIPVVKNNVIDYMYLGQSGTEITVEQRKHINYITKTQSSQDYVSEIKMNVKNALNNILPSGEITSYDDVDIPKDATCLVEEIGFKNYETYQLTNERLKLETQFPIWRLFYCELVNRVWGTVNCKRDEYNYMSLNWILSSGTIQKTIDEDGNVVLSPVTNSSSQTYKTNVQMNNILGDVFHYKIVMKCTVNTNIHIVFNESDVDVGDPKIILPVETEFKTFEGDIEVRRDVFDYIEMLLAVNSSGNETITIKSFQVQGYGTWSHSHTFDRTELLKTTKNITPYILEYSYWQTRDVYYQGYGSEMPLGTDYQNTCLYFKRGQKGIFNFSAMQTYKFLWIKNQTLVFELMMKDVNSRGRDYLINLAKELYFSESDGYYDFSGSATVPTEPGACRFRMKYEPLDECTFKASKYPLVRNARQIVDNQTNSYVDINRLGMLEYLKAKRLGNKIKIVNGRYKANETELPLLFNKIDGSIIFKKEISVYNNYIDVNYQATENYVLRDYFTSVKSKLRSWLIVGEEEAFTRADVFKFFVGQNVASINNANVKIPSYQTANDYLEKFKYCVVRFYTSAGWKPNYTEIVYNFYVKITDSVVIPILVDATTFRKPNALLMECSKHICGKSVLFTFKMLDNTLAGKYVYNNYSFENNWWTQVLIPIGFTSLIGGQQRNIKYTDNNGEITGGEIRFFNKMHATDLLQTDECFSPSMRPLVNLNGDHSNAHQHGGNFEDNDGLEMKIPFTIHKDNKEILQITIQFEISDEADNMFLGKVEAD